METVEGGQGLKGDHQQGSCQRGLEKGLAPKAVDTKTKAPGGLGAGHPKARGVLRAVPFPPAHAVAHAPLRPAPPGFSFLSVQPFLVIVGQTPSMTHPRLGFLVPAVSPLPPYSELLRTFRPRPSPSGEAAKSPASCGEV